MQNETYIKIVFFLHTHSPKRENKVSPADMLALVALLEASERAAQAESETEMEIPTSEAYRRYSNNVYDYPYVSLQQQQQQQQLQQEPMAYEVAPNSNNPGVWFDYGGMDSIEPSNNNININKNGNRKLI